MRIGLIDRGIVIKEEEESGGSDPENSIMNGKIQMRIGLIGIEIVRE